MRKASLLAMELSDERDAGVLRQRESVIYRLFESIVEEQPALRMLAAELSRIDEPDRRKRRALLDPIIDRSITKIVDLDEDGLSELVIYVKPLAHVVDGGDVYVFRQQGLNWDCIGKFAARSCPVVDAETRENGYANLRVVRLSDNGALVPGAFAYLGGKYVLDERHLLVEECGEVVLAP